MLTTFLTFLLGVLATLLLVLQVFRSPRIFLAFSQALRVTFADYYWAVLETSIRQRTRTGSYLTRASRQARRRVSRDLRKLRRRGQRRRFRPL